jgi:hypothetical protein
MTVSAIEEPNPLGRRSTAIFLKIGGLFAREQPQSIAIGGARVEFCEPALNFSTPLGRFQQTGTGQLLIFDPGTDELLRKGGCVRTGF